MSGLPNSRNTNYQAAGGIIPPKDLDDIQDGIIALHERRPVHHGLTFALNTPGVNIWSGAWLPYHKVFAFARDDLDAGIQLSWAGEELRSRGTDGPGAALGGTETKIIGAENSNVVLVCRSAAAPTTANRLCRSTDLDTLTSVTTPASHASRPKLWWAGTRFWGTFDGGTTAHASANGSTWLGAARPATYFPKAVATGVVYPANTPAFERVVAIFDGAFSYSDDAGASWTAYVPFLPSEVDSIAWDPVIGWCVAGKVGAAPCTVVSPDGVNWSGTFQVRGLPGGITLGAVRHVTATRGRMFAVLTHTTSGDFSASIGGFLITTINGTFWEVCGYIAPPGSTTLASYEVPLVAGGDRLLEITSTTAKVWA